LSLETKSGKKLIQTEQSFEMKELGDASYTVSLPIPPAVGKCVLKATAKPSQGDSTVSRRWVTVDRK
jgi:hypothetical protein